MGLVHKAQGGTTVPVDSVPARVSSRGTRHQGPMNPQSASAAPGESNEPRAPSVTGVDEPRAKRTRKGTDTTLPGELHAPQLAKSKVPTKPKPAAQPEVARAAAPATAGTDRLDDGEHATCTSAARHASCRHIMKPCKLAKITRHLSRLKSPLRRQASEHASEFTNAKN